jgi:hypothetical protein
LATKDSPRPEYTVIVVGFWAAKASVGSASDEEVPQPRVNRNIVNSAGIGFPKLSFWMISHDVELFLCGLDAKHQ